MTIQEGVEILNRVKHRNREDWRLAAPQGRYVESFREIHAKADQGFYGYLFNEDVIIIAQWYQEREPGSWLWAIEQVGKAVQRGSGADRVRVFISKSFGLFLDGCAGALTRADYQARDWQIVEENSNE